MRARQAALILAAAGLAAPLPGPASAQAMRVGDLGLVSSHTACLETAERVLAGYIAEFGGLATSGDTANPREWAIYGWGLRPGMNDVVITCPTVLGHTNAFFTVHASGGDAAGDATGDAAGDAAADADAVAERIRALWRRLY
ncbi:MAG TPA: hypothetical protein VMM59_09575 [Thermohalobaculum sp.]|nr:hypothetical protein [Thermohalobaculum sp.]